jgi:hypothetical protein
MTTPIDSLGPDGLEARLEAALRSLAEANVPDTGVAPRQRNTARLVASAAAFLLVVAGGIGVWSVSTRSPSSVQTVPPIGSVNTTGPIAATTSSAPTPAQIAGVDAADLVAILDPAVVVEKGTTLGDIDRWLSSPAPPSRSAVLRYGTGQISAVVSWSLLPDSEWDKTFANLPDIVLVGGLTAKRLEPTLVDSVVDAIRTSEGVLSASFSRDIESQLILTWFAAIADTPFAEIPVPDGFEPLPVPIHDRQAYYPDTVAIVTTVYSAPIKLDDYIATSTPGFVTQPVGRLGAELVTPSNASNRPDDAYLAWQPDPSVIVTVHGPSSRLPVVADALTLTDVASSGLTSNNNEFGFTFADGGTIESVLLGETTSGRFAYAVGTDSQGRHCSFFQHNAFGGTGGCGDDVPNAKPMCGVGWTAPDTLTAYAFIQHAATAGTTDAVQFSINGRVIQPTVDTGAAAGQDWAFYSIRESGHPDDSESSDLAIQINADPC